MVTIISGTSPYPYLECNYLEHTKRLYLTKDEHFLGRNAQQADLVVDNSWRVVGRSQAVLRRYGSEYHIFDGDGKKPSTNGLFLDRTRITPSQGIILNNGMELRIGQDPQNQVRLTYFNPSSGTLSTPIAQHSISLKNRQCELGRNPSATLQLDSPVVSWRHALIKLDRGQYVLRDYSTNGVFVDGRRVNGSAVLSSGSTIRIGPFTLVLRGDELQVLDQGNQIRLDALDLLREVKDKKGKRRKLLDRITLAIEPGQFVALVGGSGAGKSTLMRTLLGIDPTTEGTLQINGEDLRTNFNIYRTQIGYVPQDDIIHKSLTVAEVLTYAAKLRLPPDLDVSQVVEKTLEEIEMSDRQDMLVSQLSGGQRKRVSIGVELLADPKLFFLDEPTSGLDPGLDKKMMQLLRKLADQGRTVILVTHATANITQCDRIVFLGRGGRLCYFGPPQEASKFFTLTSQKDFADIYIKLEQGEHVVQQWADRFESSDYYRDYITNHLSAGNQPQSAVTYPQQVKPSFIGQLSLLSQRYLRLLWRDPVNLGLSLFTAPIGISLITLAIDKEPLVLPDTPDSTLAPLALRVLFVFTCAAIWVGLSSSLQEIVKESAIYLRERLVNLGLFAYLGSKLLILSGLALLQTLLICAVIIVVFKSSSPELIPWFLGLGITTFGTLLTSMSLGLTISALAKNGTQANSTLPLLLIPQIIFSGVLFKMEGLASKISWLMLSRWSIGAYGALVDVNGMVPKGFDGEPLPYLPFQGSHVYAATWGNLGLNWGMLCLHTLVYLGVTWLVQKRKDIF
ncbi:MAG: ATP-binding cassette domain-containing protein [Hormoscilla sp. SP12CHS1]|nr:ATP-binding cassette domain-containing protein [Hormoscilla sp. SP12CHS1]